MKILRRVILILLLAIVAIGLAAPYVRADGLRPRIESALEAALNRKVRIKKSVHLSLLTGPGFSVEDVVIADDASAGIEPFAHVESMRARVRLTSLLAGKLAFSSLRLDAPSVNLVKPEAGPWNIQPLLDHPSVTTAHSHVVPDIQIRDGRLNFKFGDTKSVFYISQADVDIYPDAAGDVVVRFAGAPARTDRGSQAFGLLSARGLLRSGDELNMTVHLERTAITEIVRLFNGRDMGLHGNAVANAKFSGPLSHIEITGDLNVNDIHRWDLMPAKGEGWTLNYRGALDFRKHNLVVETVPSESPVTAKFELTDYLTAPKWDASFTFHDLPAASLVETARHMGAPFPAGMQIEGKVKGGIGYSRQDGLKGALTVDTASVKFPNSATAEFVTAPVRFFGNRISFGPADINMENGQSAQVEAQYALDDSYAQVKLASRQLTIAELESSAERVISAPPIPLLEKLRQGTYKGWIAFERKDDQDGVWSGEYELQNAVMDIPGLAQPLKFTTASVAMSDGQIQIRRIRANSGAIKLEGDYRYDPQASRPHHVAIVAPKLDLAQLESALMPVLRRNEGFLARTFRIGRATLPKWLKDREVEGTVQVGSLTNGDSELGALKARLVWDGATILLSNVDCQLADMHAIGKVNLNVAGVVPAYRLTGSIENLAYRNGELDLEGDLDTSGIGEVLLLNIRSQGTFEGRDIELGQDAQFREITGSFKVGAAGGIPRLSLTNLQAAQGTETYTGQGSSQADGRLVLELIGGRRPLRVTGMLLPIHPEPATAR